MRRQLRVGPPRQRFDPAGHARRLERIAAEPRVKLSRVEANLGIIGGMRACLERPRGRYISPVDPDDLLTPDACASSPTRCGQAGYPAARLHRRRQARRQSLHPALLQAGISIRCSSRTRATSRTSASSTASWRWSSAPTPTGGRGQPRLGHVHAVPGRRPHTAAHPRGALQLAHSPGVDSGNIQSKPFVTAVLTKLLERWLPAGDFTEHSPVIGMPDWWMRETRRTRAQVVLHRQDRPPPRVPKEFRTRSCIWIRRTAWWLTPCGAIAERPPAARVWADTRIVDENWALEAMGLFELFPIPPWWAVACIRTAASSMRARISGSAAAAMRPIAAGRSRIPGTSPRRGSRIRSARCRSITPCSTRSRRSMRLRRSGAGRGFAGSSGRLAGRGVRRPGAPRHLHPDPLGAGERRSRRRQSATWSTRPSGARTAT